MKLITEFPILSKMCGITTLVRPAKPEDYLGVYRLFKRVDSLEKKKGNF